MGVAGAEDMGAVSEVAGVADMGVVWEVAGTEVVLEVAGDHHQDGAAAVSICYTYTQYSTAYTAPVSHSDQCVIYMSVW